MEENNSISQGEMAYDLRQRYAKIVGDHLEDITEARKNKNYSEYFNALEDLYTIVKHRFKIEKKKDKNNKEKELKGYDELRKKLVTISNKNKGAWIGNSKDPEELGEIEKSLRDIEMYLYFKMNEAGMFGTKRELEGLN